MNKINKIKEKLERVRLYLSYMSFHQKLSKDDYAYLISVGRASAYQECLEILEKEDA